MNETANAQTSNVTVIALTVNLEASRLNVHLAIHPRWLIAGATLAGLLLGSAPLAEVARTFTYLLK